MRDIKELPAWERLFKRIVWEQTGSLSGLDILDFGSGEGVTACHYAADNRVTAVEPWDEMLKNRWDDNDYTQIQGGIEKVREMPDRSFDMVICHNVLEYADNREDIIRELARVLRYGGHMSVAKHNRAGRVMQMAVLLDDMQMAHDLLDGKNSTASKFGDIRYYDDGLITETCPELTQIRTLGIRTFWDLQQDQQKHDSEEWQKEMMRLEMRVSGMSPYRDIAFFHHLILRKEERI